MVKISQLMRKALSDSQKLYRSIQEELDFVENYLEIQKIRFPERFIYKIIVAGNVDLTMKIPQMSIQTYVENSVKYGLEPLKKGGLLLINIVKKFGYLNIFIEDNGVGIETAEKQMIKGTGSGIKIMNEIYAIHNANNTNKIYFEINDLYKEGGKGTRVSIKIKLSENDKNKNRHH